MIDFLRIFSIRFVVKTLRLKLILGAHKILNSKLIKHVYLKRS